MQTIKSFLAQYNITTHTLAALAFSLVTFYGANAEAHAYINGLAIAAYNALPHWLEGLITGVIIPYLIYRKGLSTTGKLSVTADSAKSQPQLTVQVAQAASTAPNVATAFHVENAASSLVKPLALMLCSILLMGSMVGCSAAGVAQDIVNWTPTIESGVASVDATAALLDPAAAPIFTAATAGFDAAASVLVAQAKAYLANPNATILQQLDTAVVTLQSSINAAILKVAGIKNAASQQKALADINVLATAVNAVFALVQGLLPKSARVSSPNNTAQALACLDQRQSAEIVAAHYHRSNDWGARQVQAFESGF